MISSESDYLESIKTHLAPECINRLKDPTQRNNFKNSFILSIVHSSDAALISIKTALN